MVGRSTPRLFLAACVGCCSVSVGQVNFWNNSTGNRLWHDPANWSLGVPVSPQEVRLGGVPVTIELNNQTAVADRLQASVSGFVLNSGTLNSYQISLAVLGGSGTLTVRSAVQSPTGSAYFGSGNSGTINLEGSLYGAATRLYCDAALNVRTPAFHGGPTDVTSTLSLSQAGALTNSPLISVVPGRYLSILNGVSPAIDRINDAAEIEIIAAGMTHEGGDEAVGTVSFNGGTSSLLINGANAHISAGVIARRDHATLGVRTGAVSGSGLRGSTGIVAIGDNAVPTRRAIIPWIHSRNTSLPILTTYDSGADPNNPLDDIGVRPINESTEMLFALDAGSAASNVALSLPQTLSSDLAVNSLVLRSGGQVTLDNASLTINSGALLLLGPVSGTPGGAIKGNGVLRSPGELIVASSSTGYDLAVQLDVPHLTLAGSALRLTRPNAIGEVTINSGRLISAAQGAVGQGTITINGGRLVIEGESQIFDQAIRLPRVVRSITTPIGSGTNGFAAGASIEVPAGITATLNGAFDGLVAMNMLGTGRLVLNADQTVESFLLSAAPGGTVEINGNIARLNPLPSILQVAGGTVTGIGSFDGTILGNLSPGANGGVGRFSARSFNVFASQSTITLDITGKVAGSQYDQIVLQENAVLSQSGISGTVLSLLFGSYAPVPGDAFEIVKTGTGVQGTFFNLPEGANFVSGGIPLSITYAGGDGNDIVVSVVPEPSGAFAGGLIALATRSARRRFKPARNVL